MRKRGVTQAFWVADASLREKKVETVIILGAARSGTKFLRDTLASSNAVCSVPYDVNYIWRHGNESHPDDAIPPVRCNEDMRRYIRSNLERFAQTGGRGKVCRILLEKTVSNTLRVPFVDRVFPDAKFVHLIRDGRAVIESSSRMWASPADIRYLFRKIRYFPFGDIKYAVWFFGQLLRGRRSSRAIWGPRYPGIEQDLSDKTVLEVCATQWVSCVRQTAAALGELDPNRVFTLRYEDLVADTAVLQELCRFIGIPDPEVVLEAFRRTVRKDMESKWQAGWAESERDSVRAIAEPMLRVLGYDDEF